MEKIYMPLFPLSALVQALEEQGFSCRIGQHGSGCASDEKTVL